MGETALHMIGTGRLHQTQQLTQQAIVLGSKPGAFVLPVVGWPMAQYCELKQHWEPPLALKEAGQAFEQNPQSVAQAKRTRAAADYAFWVYADCRLA